MIEELLNSLSGLLIPKFKTGERVILNKQNRDCGKYNAWIVHLVPRGRYEQCTRTPKRNR